MEPDRPADGQPPIADYGFLSDCRSAALVDRNGSVDWWCVPRFDSPSVLGRLLDPQAGHWTLRPVGEFTTERAYVGDTLVLRTVFRTESGVVSVTDALALEQGARGHDLGLRSPHLLLRRVEGMTGSVAMRSELAPRMEYGRTEPHLEVTDDGARARGGPATLTLTSSVPVSLSGGAVVSSFVVAAGDTIDLRLAYSATFAAGRPGEEGAQPTLEDTITAWESWSALHTTYDGAFPDQVRRSSLVLQGLTYAPSGAIIAAATTSLPELMGGDLNFDYRYSTRATDLPAGHVEAVRVVPPTPSPSHPDLAGRHVRAVPGMHPHRPSGPGGPHCPGWQDVWASADAGAR
ncbi:MAG: glycoside hydrolase family 15 protein [Mycobacteriales bacterium]